MSEKTQRQCHGEQDYKIWVLNERKRLALMRCNILDKGCDKSRIAAKTGRRGEPSLRREHTGNHTEVQLV